jgi:flagellar hook-associated protein 1 FlgK
MSLASLLSIARSALFVHQRAMEVTGHNVANANTPGYSRQSLQIRSASPLVLPTYSLGRGVEATQITRERDTFYDAAFRRDSGMLGRSSTLMTYLGQVETSLNEPSTDGLSASLDGLFNSLSDLANDPSSRVSRDLVVSSGARVAQQLNSLASSVGRIAQEAVDNLRVQVDQVNQYSSQIADLNAKIIESNGPGGPSSDLLDQRDVLVDKLSQFMNVRVLERPDGSIGVSAGDLVIVDGTSATKLAATSVGGTWGIAPAGGGGVIDPQTGSLKALTDLIQVKLPGVQSKLDQLAASLVTEFNQLHRAGFTPAGVTNLDFFDPTGTTASTIRLSSTLKASSDNLAVSANGAAGNGDVATSLAGLATRGVASLGNSTFREFFVSLASTIGLDVNTAGQDANAQQTLVDRDDAARSATSGVNVDEEMISLIAAQQAYSAAARLVSVADQMVQQILQIGL